MAFQNKQKFALWVYPETMEKVRKTYQDDNCRSQSEFIERAIGFYWGHLSADGNTNYLAHAIQGSIDATLNLVEHRLSSLLFKLAVEMSMTMHILAAQGEVEEEMLGRLRGYCVNEVKRLNGRISFDKAWQHQRGGEENPVQ